MDRGLAINRAGFWEAGRGRLRTEGIRQCPPPEREQIGRYAEAFQGLAKLFQELPCQKERLGDEELGHLFAQVQERSCEGCPGWRDCWGTRYFQSCQSLYELLGELEKEGSISGQGLSSLSGWCLRPEETASSLEEGYRQERQKLLWENRMMEQRTAAGEQIRETAALLRRLAEGFAPLPEQERRLQMKLKQELKFLGLELGDIRIFRGDGEQREIYLTLRAAKQVCVSVKTIAELLTECCGERMRPARDCRAAVGEEFANYHFASDTRYQMLCGISRITKAGELVSGDNYALLEKDTGKVVMSLSDGMGSGVGACRESEKVIELLEQFLEAGFPQETAVRMINSCMLLQDRRQMFSTIDLCMVDLYSAGCDLLKSGAAATFIRHGAQTEVIRSAALPPGVMQQSDYESLHWQLAEEDSVIMMTDGVLEALPQEGREERMVELIQKTASRNAREYARRLMERVYLMQQLRAKDDMTILVGTIWKK